MSRFILHRVAEEFGIVITFQPKPVKGNWNGTGLHTNVSTAEMRADGGMKHIEAAMEKLEKRNVEHIEVYGEGNRDRMTGEHETASIDTFTWGVANRGASVRVPRACAAEGKGYFEDRRPASNGDPYRITGMMMETVSLAPCPLRYLYRSVTDSCAPALRWPLRGNLERGREIEIEAASCDASSIDLGGPLEGICTSASN